MNLQKKGGGASPEDKGGHNELAVEGGAGPEDKGGHNAENLCSNLSLLQALFQSN